jgi:amidophosphoribosyltransferase
MLIQTSYPHIYGIDLASRSELIAHARSSGEIAKVIGADAIIYQTLEDLKDACAELSPRPNQQFEVGVFCGKYITPVKDAYFTHLDALRGTRKMEQKIELARQAVVQGTADGNDAAIAIAAAATVTVNKKDREELQQLAEAINPASGINGINTDVQNGTKPKDEPPSPQRMQDMSLHNLNDHADES